MNDLFYTIAEKKLTEKQMETVEEVIDIDKSGSISDEEILLIINNNKVS